MTLDVASILVDLDIGVSGEVCQGQVEVEVSTGILIPTHIAAGVPQTKKTTGGRSRIRPSE